MTDERMSREDIVGLLNAAKEDGVEPRLVMADGCILQGRVLRSLPAEGCWQVYLDGFERPVYMADIVRVEGVDIWDAGHHLHAARCEAEARRDPGKMAPVVVRFRSGGEDFRAVWLPSDPRGRLSGGRLSMERLDGHDVLGSERWLTETNISLWMVQSLLEAAGVIPKVEVPS